MAYTSKNFPTKKALREAVKNGEHVTVYQPGGIFPLDTSRGHVTVEGPQYPKPHRWYAVVDVTPEGVVTRVRP